MDAEYCDLPESLISRILDSSKNKVEKLNQIYNNQLKPLEKSIEILRKETDLIQGLPEGDHTESVIAVDGGRVINKHHGINTCLAVAVGVEGFNSKPSKGWEPQYDSWNEVLLHDENSDRLCQGLMSLLELNVLAKAPHEIKIMDGTHFTPLLSIKKLLNISEEKQSPEYIKILQAFFKDRKTPPELIDNILKDKSIIALPKYSSSKDIIESDKWGQHFPKDINLDDRFFFSWHLKENQYTKPLSIGQSKREQKKWDAFLNINCKINEFWKWNRNFKEQSQHLKKQLDDNEFELYFTYYKPCKDKLAYRIECKKELVENPQEFQKLLRSIKRQVCLPHIEEPYPQFLADKMAKSGSKTLKALQDSIQFSEELDETFKHYFIFKPYRSA